MADQHVAAGIVPGPRSHDLGPGGVVSVTVEAHDVRIQGVDGTEVRVVTPDDGVGIETEGRPGRFAVRTMRHVPTDRVGFVGVRIGSREFGFPLGFRASGSIELEVPRDAGIEIRSASGDVVLRDVRGGAVVRTATGDVSIKRAAGRVAVDVASGDIHVVADEPLALEAHSVSGDVRARAPRFERVAIETISGNVALAGAFAPGPLHAVSTVSGDVEVALVGGLTVEVKSISGSVECTHPDRRDGGGRKRPLVVGDGAARLAVRSMSGDVEVRAGKSGAPVFAAGAPDDAFGFDDGRAAPRHPAPTAPRAGHLPPTPTAPPAAPRPPAPAAPLESPEALAATPPSPATPPAAPPVSEVAEVTQVAPPAAAPVDEPAVEPAILAVLEALAGGEIDVGEAERRLGTGGAAPAGAGSVGEARDAHEASSDA